MAEEDSAGLIRRWEQRIGADHSLYVVAVDQGLFGGEVDASATNGLLDLVEGRLVVKTGLDYGRVALRVETWRSAPDLDLDEWDDVVEVGLRTADGLIELAELLEGPPRGMPNLATGGAGNYRLRVSVRGRDDAFAGRGEELHRVQCWPAEPTGPADTLCHKLTDQLGRHARGEVPPTPLRPWEVAAVVAMHEFVAAVSRATADEPTTTVTATAAFPFSRRKMFTQVTLLQFLVGSGGAGPAYGDEGAALVCHGPDRAWTLFLVYSRTASASPAHSKWDVHWGRYESGLRDPWPLPWLGGQETLAFDLSWSRPQTTVTVTHTGVPLSCAHALTVLWDYWLAQLANRLGPNDCASQPWTLTV
jgi:hypothetical protein